MKTPARNWFAPPPLRLPSGGAILFPAVSGVHRNLMLASTKGAVRSKIRACSGLSQSSLESRLALLGWQFGLYRYVRSVLQFLADGPRTASEGGNV
jgi:hypothetical protein